LTDTPTSSTPNRPFELTLPGSRSLELGGRVRVMGIVNLTPDSFSDGGLFAGAEEAVEHGLRLLAEGADLLDLGAESTRPGGGVYGEGAREVSAADELARLMPVLERLRRETDAPISIDTRKASVAREALAAGGDLINDISTLGDPEMAGVVAAAGCPLVLMHSRGDIATMQQRTEYGDLLGEIRDELLAAVARAEAAGVGREKLLLDPGIGFGKTWEQNVELLARVPCLVRLGFPVLIGASRKSFIGHLTGGAPPRDRLAGSLAAVAWAARGGAAMVRVHDVGETVRFLRVWQAIAGKTGREGA